MVLAPERLRGRGSPTAYASATYRLVGIGGGCPPRNQSNSAPDFRSFGFRTCGRQVFLQHNRHRLAFGRERDLLDPAAHEAGLGPY